MREEKLSVRLEARAAEMDRRLGATDVQVLLREAAQLARRVEEAPSFTVERVVSAGLTWNGVDVTDFAEYGQRVRLMRVE